MCVLHAKLSAKNETTGSTSTAKGNTLIKVRNNGTIDPEEDPAQLAFEIEAALFLANAQFVVVHTSEPIERGRAAIARRLSAATRRPG